METGKFEGKMPENDEEFVKILIFLAFFAIFINSASRF